MRSPCERFTRQGGLQYSLREPHQPADRFWLRKILGGPVNTLPVFCPPRAKAHWRDLAKIIDFGGLFLGTWVSGSLGDVI